jgi:probable rRNA maturation factor
MIVLAVPNRRIKKAELAVFAARAQRAVGLRGGVDVLLADDAELKRLNGTFRGKKKATDVLSFPADELLSQDGGTKHAGDIAISLETAARQAAEFGHSLQSEVKILLLHGLLHLNGMDHETDEGEMAAREEKLRARLKLPVNLIARSCADGGRKGNRAVRDKRKAR